MEFTFTWHGTANLKVEPVTPGQAPVIHFDPWFARNDRADPQINAGPTSVDETANIFISHGHFDHLADIAEILTLKKGTNVYCSERAKKSVHRDLSGILEDEAAVDACLDRVHAVQAGETVSLPGGTQVQVIKSRHIVFDLKSIFKALFKGETWKRFGSLIKAVADYPMGDVFGYDVVFPGGERIVFYGSLHGGYKKLLEEHKKPSALVLPIAGRFNAARIALDIVDIMKPKIVIPVHHDDFFPPISYWCPTADLEKGVREERPGTTYLELPFEKPECLDL